MALKPNVPSPAGNNYREAKVTPPKASPDPAKASTRENLNTTFGKPQKDK